MKSTFLEKVPGTTGDPVWTEYYRLENDGQPIHPEDLQDYVDSCRTGFGETAGRRCVTWSHAWLLDGGTSANLMLECCLDV